MKNLIVFDLDGTLIHENSWFLFNKLIGLTEEDDNILFKKYINSEISYDEWTKSIVSIYKNKNTPVSKSEVEKLAESLKLREDSFEVLEYLRSKNYNIVIISGSMDVVVSKIAEKLNVDNYFSASKIIFDENQNILDIKNSGDERGAKFKILQEYCAQNDYSLDNVIAIGDGGNDLEIFNNVKGVVLGTNPELTAKSWKQITNLSDLKGIL